MALEVVSASEIGRQIEIKNKLEQINSNTTNEEKGGVILFDSEKVTPAQEKANAVFDDLMLTLQNIGEEAAKKALEGYKSREAEQVLQEVLDATVVLRAFADRKITFQRAITYEEKAKRKGDVISAFQANYIMLGNKPYDVGLMIRSKQFEKLASVGKTIEFDESREPRLRFDITPHHSDDFTITIRIDPGQQITFDIILKNIDNLNFESAGQTEGHHFPSGLPYQDLKTSFSETLEAIKDFVQVEGTETQSYKVA